MSKKASRSQDGKQPQNGKPSRIGALRETGNLTKWLNQPINGRPKLQLMKSGSLGAQILIGLYYCGPCRLCDLKWLGNTPENTYMGAIKLLRNGLINKAGPVYSLTDNGCDIVEPFVEFFRTMEGLPGRKVK